ncbi:MAG: trehalose-phosphatase [Acetobacteraceae bacterium]
MIDRLPPFRRTALLLDMDGTLLDIAPTPDAVVVEPGLQDSLRALRGHLDNAVAVVTGRPIEVVDRLLDDAIHAVAGEHGGAVRPAPGEPVQRPEVLPPPEAWLHEAERLVAAYPGALLERKARGFALHYRNAPEAGPVFHDALAALVSASRLFQLLPAHMLWEIRPQGTDKGRAVDILMQRPPFAQRLPVFIGDDVTDEDGMRVARAMGGAGLRVDVAFSNPTGVRAWLREAAALGDWPPIPGEAA